MSASILSTGGGGGSGAINTKKYKLEWPMLGGRTRDLVNRHVLALCNEREHGNAA